MKHCLFIAFIFSLVVTGVGAAPLPLQLSFNKTTILIFPAKVIRPDAGSADIILQQLEGAGNMLLLKAAVRGFDSTNLHIVTADGRLYSFAVSYAENPARYDYDFRTEPVVTEGIDFNNELKQSVLLDTVIRRLSAEKTYRHRPGDHSGGVGAWVTGIYYASDLLFIKVKLKNTSYVPYTLDFTRSTIASRKKVRQKALQETELAPIVIYNPAGGVGADTSSTLMFVYDKFTLSGDKVFTLHLYEKGERHLKISVKSNRLRWAHVLTDRYWK